MAANPTSLNTGAGKNSAPAAAQHGVRRRTFDPVSNLQELRVPAELIEAAKVRIDAVGNDVTDKIESERPISEALKTDEALRRAGFWSDGEPNVKRNGEIAFPLQAIGYAVIALICRLRHPSAWFFRAAGIGLAMFASAWCPPALTALLAQSGALVAHLPTDPSAYANDGSSAAWQVARAVGRGIACSSAALLAVWTAAALRREEPISPTIPGARRGYRAVVTGFAGPLDEPVFSKVFGETRITWMGLLVGGVIETAVFYVATPIVLSLF